MNFANLANCVNLKKGVNCVAGVDCVVGVSVDFARFASFSCAKSCVIFTKKVKK